MNNETWSYEIIDQLLKQGVRRFCFAPGARSMALIFALQHFAEAETYSHFDERALGFYAVGWAKATHEPIAVIVTSGTAVGNLLPAVMEADQCGLPLLLLTADRPVELYDCSFNQTTDQVKIFAPFVRWSMELASPHAQVKPRYLASTMSRAAEKLADGPVHLNCHFPEPYLGLLDNSLEPSSKKPVLHEKPIKTYPDEVFSAIAKKLEQYEKGLIVLGEGKHDIKSIERLSSALGWPIFADLLSGCRTPASSYFYEGERIDAILHLGRRVQRKKLLITASPDLYVQVEEKGLRTDPAFKVTDQLRCESKRFCEAILPYLSVKGTPMPGSYPEALKAFFAQAKRPLSEPSLFYALNALALTNPMFLGTSMPVRDADMFLLERLAPTFSNRGVSGIDGNIATAKGIADGLNETTLAFIGDQTFLHDLNSLSLLKEGTPLILVVFNNSGGRIYNHFPLYNKWTQFCDRTLSCEHTLTFAHAAELFELPYVYVTESEEWLPTLELALDNEVSCLIEVKTCHTTNLETHRQISSFCTDFSGVQMTGLLS